MQTQRHKDSNREFILSDKTSVCMHDSNATALYLATGHSLTLSNVHFMYKFCSNDSQKFMWHGITLENWLVVALLYACTYAGTLKKLSPTWDWWLTPPTSQTGMSHLNFCVYVTQKLGQISKFQPDQILFSSSLRISSHFQLRLKMAEEIEILKMKDFLTFNATWPWPWIGDMTHYCASLYDLYLHTPNFIQIGDFLWMDRWTSRPASLGRLGGIDLISHTSPASCHSGGKAVLFSDT